MFGELLLSEVKKIEEKFASLTGLKHQLYEKADALLVEGQGMSKEKIDEWFEQKRAELKAWAGE